MKNLESLVMSTSRSIQINEAYQNEIKKMEAFLNEVAARPNLTDAEQTCIVESREKIAQIKQFVADHKAQVQKHLEDNNLGIIYNVAEAFNGFLR
jgi:hypothetical protein